jgi:hypothetical protein
MRHRFFPVTAGERQGLPERVLAPQRRLASIAAVFRLCCPIILQRQGSIVLGGPERAEFQKAKVEIEALTGHGLKEF